MGWKIRHKVISKSTYFLDKFNTKPAYITICRFKKETDEKIFLFVYL